MLPAGYIVIGGKLSYSSNGSNNICVSNRFSVRERWYDRKMRRAVVLPGEWIPPSYPHPIRGTHRQDVTAS